MAQMKRPKAEILTADGQFARIKFVLNGQIVSGDFKLYLWNSPPAAYAAKVDEALRSAPKAWYGGPNRKKPGSPAK
jgi:hypothetical protein